MGKAVNLFSAHPNVHLYMNTYSEMLNRTFSHHKEICKAQRNF